ncbi:MULTISPECIES: alpha/beta hydrolase [unclassified Herbaspirillum]|uniref:alpha/beta fold hydrolase n=1 Tax=unclassified Herbaspirillum TaxID=2624150 RepID=UPI000E2F31D8|nr:MULTISPECIES: alpha/beta hydrolase [unclassified Herbaspirillum]RFB73850.1 alpha/beta hydrolase [Herbaspirillum sp. 3R-3a1]TFI10339.1 alpha/beta hydrolase [Herbaspirillum sp. 3R11]TFI16243.1 alpha/beta hydrolase [Herbaspirillum sp. 3R-11]TFI28340.1 alpha/beta hydrolase [Herbaspirillum sp. 3C11]
MTQAVLKTVQCISPTGLHSMAYKEWGDAHNPNVLVCVHGVTRVSDDFDVMARDLCDTYRVVCPDVVGRGRSGRLGNPQHYAIPQYVSDMVTLLARLDADSVDWFGTSMGGLIGMGLASLPDNPIRRLVLNDIGPSINGAALARIGEYIGQDVRFDTFDEAALYIRTISASFGPHTDEEWHKLASDVLRQDEQGKWKRHYDLRLAEPFKTMTPEAASIGEAMLWAAYDAIRCPTLLVRGAQSDLLLPEVAQAMTQRGPKAKLVELEGVGHAPTFMHAQQIQVAKDFLLG